MPACGVRTVPGYTPHVSPLSPETAIAEKLVVHSPLPSQLLMDMKFMNCFPPAATPAVGMMPVSSGAALMEFTTCLAMPGRHTGAPA